MSSLGIFNKETKTYQKVAGTAEAAVLDKEMSDISENPVQNKVIKKYVDDHAPNITVDTTMSDTSENPVQNKVIKKYVNGNIAEINLAIQSLSEAIPTFERNGSIFQSGDAAWPTWANGRISSTYKDDENGRTLHYKFPRTGAYTECSFHLNIPAHTVVLCQFYSNRGVVSIDEPLFLYNQEDDTSLDKWVHCTITGAEEDDVIEVTCNVIAIKNV